MTIKEILSLVNGTLLCGEALLGEEQSHAFASDLMSDVLTVKTNNFLLITGLANPQSIRTAEMSDVRCVLLVRGKAASEEMLVLAQENDMVLMASPFSMFKTAGILYSAGLKPVY